jgi:phosphoglucomutase
MIRITFATSGWRAIIADQFTFANVRLVTEAIGRYVTRRKRSPTVLAGYHTRFASEDFGREVARVLSSQNIRARLCSQAVPTPAVTFTAMNEKLDGAINITASHNPGEYNGLNFLLITKTVASRGKSLKNQLKDLFSRAGEVYNRPLNVELDPAISERVKTKIASEVKEFHGRQVGEQNRVDGLKLLLAMEVGF